jgi:UDP-N-acetylglucosamine--N-acetylmuramyl-(pentapeptide) pyrophosphoryl-undecaprenol N-acetylglucosamine transferase
MADAGGAVIAREDQLTVETMSNALARLLVAPDRLARMAAGAASLARPDAAERLADLVEAVAAEGRGR